MQKQKKTIQNKLKVFEIYNLKIKLDQLNIFFIQNKLNNVQLFKCMIKSL